MRTTEARPDNVECGGEKARAVMLRRHNTAGRKDNVRGSHNRSTPWVKNREADRMTKNTPPEQTT